MKIYLHNLGCIKNQKDGDIALSKFLDGGYSLVHTPEIADIILVNTCGFIDEAKEESISETLKMMEFKKQNCKHLIMMGCLSQRYASELVKEIPEVDLFVGVNNFDKILNYLNKKIKCQIESNNYIYEDANYLNVLSAHNITNRYKNTSFVKISEGCSNFCSYCSIPYIRGDLRFRNINNIIDEININLSLGVKEIILIGQDLTSDNKFLKDLLFKISKLKTKPKWLRLMYCNPWGVDKELIKIIKEEKFICDYMDVPIQHISSNVLKAMNRKSSNSQIKETIQSLYESGISLRTTVMTGFPGETENDFEELRSFINNEYFLWLGVFVYSPQENTKAYEFKNTVKKEDAIRRRNEIDSLQFNITTAKLEAYVDKKLEVIVDNFNEDNLYEARAYFQAPEVDGLILIDSKKIKEDILNVNIEEVSGYDLIATL